MCAKTPDSVAFGCLMRPLLALGIHPMHRMLNGNSRNRLGHNFGRRLGFNGRLNSGFRFVNRSAHKCFGCLRLVGLNRSWLATVGSKMSDGTLPRRGRCCLQMNWRGLRSTFFMPHNAIDCSPSWWSGRGQRFDNSGPACTEHLAGKGVVALAVKLNDVIVPHVPSLPQVSVSYI